jgi:hypothetical protein
MTLNPGEVIRSFTVSGEGWKKARVEFQNGPKCPMDGLVDPDGVPWEAFRATITSRITQIRAFAQNLINQQRGGYDQRLVEVEGVLYHAERYEDNIALWGGLDFVGEWIDQSCCGMPDQHMRDGLFRGIPVYLYLRWRWEDPWSGKIVKCHYKTWTPSQDIPWSPDLLPQEPPQERPKGALFDFLGTGEVLDTRFVHDDVQGAKEALEAKADKWLRENFTTWGH